MKSLYTPSTKPDAINPSIPAAQKQNPKDVAEKRSTNRRRPRHNSHMRRGNRKRPHDGSNNRNKPSQNSAKKVQQPDRMDD